MQTIHIYPKRRKRYTWSWYYKPPVGTNIYLGLTDSIFVNNGGIYILGPINDSDCNFTFFFYFSYIQESKLNVCIGQLLAKQVCLPIHSFFTRASYQWSLSPSDTSELQILSGDKSPQVIVALDDYTGTFDLTIVCRQSNLNISLSSVSI